MVPEPQLRELLGQLNLKSAWEEGLEAIEIAKDANNIPAVHHGYTTLIAQYPDRAELRLEAAAFYLKQGQFTEAEALLADIPPDQIAVVERATALQGIIQFHRDAATLTPDSAAAALYLAGAQAAIAQDYETALEKFLTLVQRDRTYQKDAGRKALLTLFTLLSNDHPLTREYRKRLMQALY
jgi:putative thioredoxin